MQEQREQLTALNTVHKRLKQSQNCLTDDLLMSMIWGAIMHHAFEQDTTPADTSWPLQLLCNLHLGLFAFM